MNRVLGAYLSIVWGSHGTILLVISTPRLLDMILRICLKCKTPGRWLCVLYLLIVFVCLAASWADLASGWKKRMRT